MAEVSRNGHEVQCPLCDGQAHFRREYLISQLSNPHFMENLAKWRQALLESLKDEQDTVCATAETFEQKVRSWPGHEILWRRSPKE